METRFENGKRVIRRWNRVFKALSAEPRRQVVATLLDAPPDGTVALPESAVNPNVPPDPGDLRRDLHHHHLPLLADGGFVEWERDPLVATRGPRFEEAAIVMEVIRGAAGDVPDALVVGCQRLETERQR
jgi:hypothetical protein